MGGVNTGRPPPPEKIAVVESRDAEMREKYVFWDNLTLAMKIATTEVPDHLSELPEDELEKVVYGNPSINKPIKRSMELDAAGGVLRADSVTTKDIDDQLRERFWLEVTNAATDGRVMYVNNICRGIVQSTTFFQRVLKSPLRWAWIIYPLQDFELRMAALLRKGVNRLSEILDMPLYQQKCRCHYKCVCRAEECNCYGGCICPPTYDPRIANVILMAYEKVELRVKGSIPQVVKQQTLSVQLHGKAPERGLPKSRSDIEDEIAKLRKKLALPTVNEQLGLVHPVTVLEPVVAMRADRADANADKRFLDAVFPTPPTTEVVIEEAAQVVDISLDGTMEGIPTGEVK